MSHMTLKGYYRDCLIDEKGNRLFDSGWRPNMIVVQCRQLLAAFMRNENAMGIKYLKVGRGDAAWDDVATPVQVPESTAKLFDSDPVVYDRTKLPDNVSFDFEYIGEDGNRSDIPTNRIQVTTRLGMDQPSPATDPPFPLREFGLYGELGGKEYMIDYVRHPLIEKDGSITFERKIRLIF